MQKIEIEKEIAKKKMELELLQIDLKYAQEAPRKIGFNTGETDQAPISSNSTHETQENNLGERAKAQGAR